MKQQLYLERHCYLLMQGNWIHPIAYKRESFLWYPERAMRLTEQCMYEQFEESIVTENPWLVSLYPCERVWVVGENGRWENPNIQTYAGNHTNILYSLLNFTSCVPAMPLDGGEAMKKVISNYEKRITKARKLYS